MNEWKEFYIWSLMHPITTYLKRDNILLKRVSVTQNYNFKFIIKAFRTMSRVIYFRLGKFVFSKTK